LSAKDNWEQERPADRHRLESLRELAVPDLLVIHPVGTLRISQKVVPLNLPIERVGSQRPADGPQYAIAGVQVGPTAEPAPPAAQEAFAPAQFFDLTDAEKLASPSFQRFDSGVRVGDPERLHTAYAAARVVKYERKYIDAQRDQRLGPPATGGPADVDVLTFNAWTRHGALASSELSFARRRKSPLAPDAVGVLDEAFTIVNMTDLTPFGDVSVLSTERAALERRDALIAADPRLRDVLQVVPAFEMSA
jgi:hypothetical protein